MVPLLVLLTLAVLGCQGPFDDALAGGPELRERLRTIETLDLQAMSRPVEDAPPPPGVQPPLRRPEGAEEPGPPPPPEWVPLTVGDCRAIALGNNLDLRVQRLTPTIARTDVSEAQAAFESLFFVNANYTDTDTPTASQLAGSQIEALNFDAGLTVPLRTGGAVTVNVPVSRVQTNNVFTTLNPSIASDLTVSISQPLLRNAGPWVNNYPIRIARLGVAAGEARTKLAIIQVLSEVERTYWLLYAARRELDVRRQELALAEALLERARRLVRAGQAAEVEIIRAESGVAERQEAIILAQNSVQDRQRELKRILNKPGLEMGTPTRIEIATDPNPVRYSPRSERLIAAALDNRMELLELELQLLQDAAAVELAENQTLPLVNLTYAYNINGLGGTYRDSFDLLREADFADHQIGGRVELPLGNEAAESRLRRAILTRLQTLGTRQQRRRQIVQEVLAALDQLQANWQRILASRRRAALAARVLEAEQRQFEQGLRTSTEVLEAQTNLADARSAEVSALAEYQIAQVDIAFATGTLLGAADIRWEPAEPMEETEE